MYRALTALASLASFACLCLPLSAANAAGSTFPDHPITFIVASPAGSTPDTGSRAVAQAMARALGQSIVVENRPGANGQIAAEAVVKSPADGYTVLIAAGSTMAINPHIYPNQAVNVLKDLTAVGKLYSTDFFLIVRSNSGIHSMAELIARAKQKPGSLVAANSGPGSAAQLATEVLKEQTGTDIYQVAFNGSPAAALAVAAGNADMLIETQTVTQPFVSSGQVRRLATTGADRNPADPSVPTMAQAGVPGMVISSWAGIFARTAVPRADIERLNTAMNQALQDPAVRKALLGTGLTPGKGSSTDFQTEWMAQSQLWAGVVARSPGLTNR